MALRAGDLRDLGIHTPQNYGARADGSTNCQPAFDKATAAIRKAGGGVLQIPPGFYLVDQIRLVRNMTVVGAGRASRVRQNVVDEHLVVLDDPDVEWTTLAGLWLDGHSEAQRTANDAVHYDNTGGRFTFFDTVHTIRDLLVYTPSGSGVFLSADSRESRVSDVYVTGAGRHGFHTNATDSMYVNCTTGGSGSHGWLAAGGNSKHSNCKTFGSGRTDPAADGFHIVQPGQMFSACEAQDNARHGYLAYQTRDLAFAACAADSNGVGGGQHPGGSGWRLDHTENVTLQGVAFNRDGRRDQAYALELVSAGPVQAQLAAHDHALGSVSGATAAHRITVA